MDRLLDGFVRFFVRWIPDSFVVAILLTLLTFFLAVTVAGEPPLDAVLAWGDSVWHLLAFTNQITLTLLLGFALANTPAMRALLVRCAGIVRSPTGGYVVACWITGVCSLVSWGLALIASGIASRAIGEHCRRHDIPVHYPLLTASSFSGFVIWHQGLSSSIGLSVASPGHFLEAQMGLLEMSQTIFSAWNVGLVLAVLLTLPFVMSRLHPRDPAAVEPMPDPIGGREERTRDGATLEAEDARPAVDTTAVGTPAERVEDSRLLGAAIVLLGAVYLFQHFFVRERGLSLDVFNLGFLLAGIALAGSPIRYMRIIVEGGRVAVPLLLQYPFYAGIAGLMAETGLARMIVEQFIRFADADTLPLFGFLSGGLLNLFVPSGGGQWALQGPILIAAALEIGADLPRTTMSVVLGDQWTNLIHPLTLTPIVLVAQIPLRKIMPYTFAAVLYTGIVFAIAVAIPVSR
ncbi:MAG: short-chain fatty acid transporter [Deltaproteobacteria bacterium]|nr:short-chain fatty acid transporter [Deltaproteobacteria bacterium]